MNKPQETLSRCSLCGEGIEEPRGTFLQRRRVAGFVFHVKIRGWVCKACGAHLVADESPQALIGVVADVPRKPTSS